MEDAQSAIASSVPGAGVSSRWTVYSRFSLKTLSGTHSGMLDIRGIPIVIAPVGSMTQGSIRSSNQSVTI